MHTQLSRIVTADHLRLDGLLFEPEEAASTVVAHVHGMSGNFYENRFLDAMADAYVGAGWAFLALNTRGHDFVNDTERFGSREEYQRVGQVFERFEDCVLDLDGWLDYLKAKGYRRVVLSGHSLGSVKAVYFLSRSRRPEVAALVLGSPLDMLGMMRVERERANFERDLAEARCLVAEGRGDAILSHRVWDCHYKSAQSYVNCFADGAATDVFPILRDGEFRELESIDVPVLAFFGGNDATVVRSPAEDLAAVARHLRHPKSQALLIGTAPHSYFGHETALAETVTRWLSGVL